MPPRGATISFSIFIASTTQEELARDDAIAVGHRDRQNGALHRARDGPVHRAVAAAASA